jgi:hypothetical protein
VFFHAKHMPSWLALPEHRNDWQWLGAAHGCPSTRRAAQMPLASPSSDVQNSPGRQVSPLHDIPTSLRKTQRPLLHIVLAPAQGIDGEHDWSSTGMLRHVFEPSQ